LISEKCADSFSFKSQPDTTEDKNISVSFSVAVDDTFYTSLLKVKSLKNENFDIFTSEDIVTLGFITNDNATAYSELQLASTA